MMAHGTNGDTALDIGDDDVFYATERPKNSFERTENTPTKRNGNSRVKTIDRYGFIKGPHSPITDLKDPLPREVHWNRERKWLDMLKNWDYWMSKKFIKVRDRCRKGIPDSVRARVWQNLSCSTQLQQHNKLYKVYLKLPISSKQETEIRNDLHRSFPTHNMFADDGGEGQKQLYRVLRAYTAYNPEDGFCQAYAPIVSVLLMHMHEEQAFWVLVAMLDKYLPGYYSGQLEEVEDDGKILIKLLRRVHPKLHKRLMEAHIDAPLFMVEWFMCLFARDLPWPSVLRVWDIFFCEGPKILFRVALVILKYSTAYLSKPPTEFYELLSCLKIKNMPLELLQPDFLISQAYYLPISDKDMMREHKKISKLRKKAAVVKSRSLEK